MENNFTIRPAHLQDAPAIAKAHVASWQKAFRGILTDEFLDNISIEERSQKWERILNRASEDKACTLVLEIDNTIQGFAGVGRSRDENTTDNVGEVMAIYLHPNVWKKGLGKKLLQEAIEILMQQNYTEVTLWVLSKNQRAIAFYERCGFYADGAEKEVNIGGTDVKEIRLLYKVDMK